MMRAILGLLAGVALLSGAVLESAAAEAVGKAFASKPEQIFVQIASQARN